MTNGGYTGKQLEVLSKISKFKESWNRLHEKRAKLMDQETRLEKRKQKILDEAFKAGLSEESLEEIQESE